MKLIVEGSPHFAGPDSTRKIMGLVCLALLPTVIAATVLYGLAAPLLVLVCIATALVCEHLCCIAMHRESTADDFSAVVTAMLLSMTLPADCPFWAGALGTAFAIVVVKMLFGGIGCNIANPAVAGRVFLMVALPALAALGAGTGGTYFFMKRKERKMYEELAESNNAAAGRHSDDGDTGAGGGV